MNQNYKFTLVRLFEFPLESVFASLTTPKALSKFTGKAAFEPKQGAAIQMFDGWVTGEILQVELNKTFIFTWKVAEWESASTVEYHFDGNNESCKVTLHHYGFPNKKESDSHKLGWEEYVFTPLAEYLTAKH